jgi:hypothetical protein
MSVTAVDQIRDLGIIVDSHLNFHTQALAAVAKAKRFGHYLLKHLSFVNVKMLRILINSYIRPHLEYCIQAWRPFYRKSTTILESTFRHFTKRCRSLSKQPYPERLRLLGLTSMQTRFDRGDLLLAFKIIRGFDLLTPDLFFPMAPSNKTRGHDLKIQLQPFRTNLRKGTFSQRVALKWNNLEQNIVSSTSINDFKARFDRTYQQ